MTYTINQAVDIDAAVDIGNIQVSTNTISSTNTNGNITLSPNGTGNVGIGISSPDTKLHIYDNSSSTAIFIGEDGTTDKCGIVKYLQGDGNGTGFMIMGNWGDDLDNNGTGIVVKKGGNVGIGTTSPSQKLHVDGALYLTSNPSNPGDSASASFWNQSSVGPTISGYSFSVQTNGTSESLRISNNGYVGVGTNDPKAKLHVNGVGDSGTSLASAIRKYFNYDSSSGLGSNTATEPFNWISIYGTHRIVSSDYIVSHGTTSYSDTRIKKDIVDIDDASALETIRLIKPKKYSYVDTVSKGSEPVWGFIAQEVKSTLDYAVNLMEKAIPNVYCTATVVGENYDMLELSNFDTVNLQYTEGTLLTKLNCKTWDDREIEVTIEEILSSSKIRLSKPLESNDCNSSDGSIVDTIFVYGQTVNDFHVLKKDAIFTVAVAALQEIDRRQTTDNERILELEGDLATAQETITSQDQRIVTLEAQVAALLQHTGVTI